MVPTQFPGEEATPEELLVYISSVYSWQTLLYIQQMSLENSRQTTEEIRRVSSKDISELELKQLLGPRVKNRTFRKKTIDQVLEKAKVIKSLVETLGSTLIEIDKEEWTICVCFYKSDGSW
jgi:hypothetical protein